MHDKFLCASLVRSHFSSTSASLSSSFGAECVRSSCSFIDRTRMARTSSKSVSIDVFVRNRASLAACSGRDIEHGTEGEYTGRSILPRSWTNVRRVVKQRRRGAHIYVREECLSI